MKKHLLILITAFLIPSELLAQPIEISADNALEWHREKQQYIAKGNATATQNDTTISADTLTAHYTSENDNSEISKIIAQGNVIITSPDGVINGDHGTYIVASEHATLTGENLKLIGEKITVEASESFEYWTKEQKFKATGHAKIIEETRTLTADEVTAWFIEQNNESQESGLREASALGNVVIITDTDTAHGDQGHYDGIKEIATLENNVKILRDKNVLNGDKATVNLKTGISTLSTTKTGNRVTGTFYPESKN